MSFKCKLLRSLDEANDYLECVSKKIKRKKKKKCENKVKNDFSELFKCLYCKDNKKDCH